MTGRKKEVVTILPNKLNIEGQAWRREARLVHINGCGALRWENLGDIPDAYWGSYYLSRLMLGDTPLLSRKDPGCPTCESLLATGYGLSETNQPELERIRQTLNDGFTHLEDAIEALMPLLGLLGPGLYFIVDGDAYPVDGNGNFFWNVPNELTIADATARVQLNDDDFEYEYPAVPPVFLYPSQRRSCFDAQRAAYYEQRLRQDGPPPRALALHCTEGVSLLLDGHHKAAAAAKLRRTVPCITIIPAAVSFEMSRIPGIQPKPFAAYAGCFSVKMDDIPAKFRPDYVKYTPKHLDAAPDLSGCLADMEWPEEYKKAGGHYPTAKEYALVAAAEIGYPTDGELAEWTKLHWEKRKELRAALVLLRVAGDLRLKAVALQCADIPDDGCSLKEESFWVLATMKGDPDVEQLFVDFLVDLDPVKQYRSTGTDRLAKIVDSFWE